MKKFAFVILFVLLLVSCSQKELVKEDKLQFEIQNVNKQELELLVNRASNFTKQEIELYYAVIVLNYQILNGNKFHNLTVKHDFDWDAFMSEIELNYGPKYMNGEGRSSNFKNGSFKQDSERFIFYAKDFSSEQLQSIFETYKINISWQQNADGKIVEETIRIGDFLQDKR
ncbi:hypothetical protein ACIP9G_02180 [Lysinibacillus sp. NPDC093197]|uniref:hypothetical protein n=1 Tax=Lysinibacillus sp. NPDC093197 TaxID=3364132 RepID=UPI00381450CC